MAAQKLILDDFLDEQDYTLIGIHCAIDGYRLAYFLNHYLDLKLKRKSDDLDFQNQIHYPIYEWFDKRKLVTWHLVANLCKVDENVDQESGLLFTTSGTSKNFYLVPEYQKVNYFLKISSDYISESKQKIILKNIQSIPQIVTAYTVNTELIKSKNNLIFY